jgi:hypothetical protein
MRVASKLTLVGTALLLVAAACSGDDDASPEVSTGATATNTSTTTAPSTTAAAAPSTTSAVLIEVPLPTAVTETYSIPGFGYSIDYPSGWFVETRGSVTIIAQTEEELEARFSDSNPPPEALGVGLDHRTVTFLQGIGLTSDDPTAEDLVEFNTNNFDWTDVRDLAEVEVFGATAIRVRVTNPEGGDSIQYQGVRPDNGEIFLFGIEAATDESLDAFLPAWDAMFESITATE